MHEMTASEQDHDLTQVLQRNLLIGGLLAIAVLLWVLGGGRGVWVLALSIPLSLLLGIAAAGAFVLFSPRLHPLLHRLRPLLRRLRLEALLRDVYLALHAYRTRMRLLGWAFALTVTVQAARVLAIWCAGKAVGVDLSPRPFYVMGPLLFLVMLVPFTINGLAVRESFFVSFLGSLGVSADRAFSAGFLFFVVTVAVALPGSALVAWGGVRAGAVAQRAAYAVG